MTVADPKRIPEPGDVDWRPGMPLPPDPLDAAKEFLSRPDILGGKRTSTAKEYAETGQPTQPLTMGETARQYLIKTGQPTGGAPQVGEQRHGQTESVEWDGSKWNPIEKGSGYHPGLESTWPQLQGFLSGAAEAATPGKIGTMAALAAPLTGGATLPLAMGAGGLAGLSEFLQSKYQTPNAPQSFTGGLAGAGEAAAAPVIQAGMGKALGAASRFAPDILTAAKSGNITGPVGGAIGGYEGYKREGIPGAVVGGITGYTAGKAAPGILGRGIRAVRSLTGLGGDAVEGAEAAAGATRRAASEPLSGFAGQARSETSAPNYRPSAPWTGTPKPSEVYWPQGETVVEQSPPLTPRDPGWKPTVQPTPAPTPETDQDWRSAGNALANPRVNPFRAEDMSGGGLSNVNLANMPSSVQGISSDFGDTLGTYGRTGQPGAQTMQTAPGVAPAAAKPPLPQQGWSKPTMTDSLYGLESPEVGKPTPFDVTGGTGARVGEETPGLTIGTTPPPTGAPTSRSLQGIDPGAEFWGPGSTTRAGGVSMAPETGRTMDPQTPSSYVRQLRDAALKAGDRPGAEFYQNELRRRANIAARPGKNPTFNIPL